MSNLEKQFENEMLGIYRTAKKECGYNAVRFLQLVSEKGGLAAAKQLINKTGVTDGFTTLWEHHRLDLSVEAHVLKLEYADNTYAKGVCDEVILRQGVRSIYNVFFG